MAHDLLHPGQRTSRLLCPSGSAFDYAQVDYLPGHELPRHGLRGLGADLCIKITKEVTLMLGYGYGLDAPRNGGFGGHEAHTLLELKF